MGIVLPEGVLNNTNLQKIRDYVESRAKILLIVSIPQDVFIASGATVKPSLLFFKKFSEEEAEQYQNIKANAQNEITAKYEAQTQPIREQLALKGKEAPNASVKKQLRAELKQLEERITNEIKTQVKTEFNYQIPIAEVEKAGISTTGATIENELEPLAIEFKKYREANQLWTKHSKEIHYQIAENEIQRIRVVDGITSEPEVF